MTMNATTIALESPPFTVAFEYDEPSQKWEVFVHGATTPLEALQGFNAVVITMRDATPRVECNRAEKQANGSYKISVGLQPLMA